jgi:alpha-L-fucosidase
MTLDLRSWGFRRNAEASDYLSPQALISQLVSTVSCGGNFLINAGPTRDGMIPAIQEERLLQMGQWLGINGDAIYESTPWKVSQNDSSTKGVWYTSKGSNKVFAIILEEAWPQEEDSDGQVRIVLGSVDSKSVSISNITMLGQRDPRKTLSWTPCDGKRCKNGILVTLPVVLPLNLKWAWTLLLTLK